MSDHSAWLVIRKVEIVTCLSLSGLNLDRIVFMHLASKLRRLAVDEDFALLYKFVGSPPGRISLLCQVLVYAHWVGHWGRVYATSTVHVSHSMLPTVRRAWVRKPRHYRHIHNKTPMLKSIKYDLVIALSALVLASLIGAYSVAQ